MEFMSSFRAINLGFMPGYRILRLLGNDLEAHRVDPESKSNHRRPDSGSKRNNAGVIVIFQSVGEFLQSRLRIEFLGRIELERE